MQKDMHYDGVYALARAAGVKPAVARVIATASQYVDDALDDQPFDLSPGDGSRGSILPTMTSHKPMDYRNAIESDQWRVWLPFHFLPGNEGNKHEERLTCRNNSLKPEQKNDGKTPANSIIRFAVEHAGKPWGPHLAGVVAHVYADTFAHYGFIGRGSPRNRVKNTSLKIQTDKTGIWHYIKNKGDVFIARNAGRLAEHVPVGHGAVATYPDRPYLRWKVKFEGRHGRKIPKGPAEWRDNRKDFLKASEYLFTFFSRLVKKYPKFASPKRGKPWLDIRKVVKDILANEGKKHERIEKWGSEAATGRLFPLSRTDIQDGCIAPYHQKDWEPSRIADLVIKGKDPKKLDGVLFFHAAVALRQFIHQDLLGGLGLITFP